jgi:outer membrane lipoprotein-sorting protein
MRRFLILVCCAALRAQNIPDAVSILERSAHALDAYHSYQFEYSAAIENTGFPATLMGASISGMGPGRMRIEFKHGAGPSQTVVYDGQATWTYTAGEATYWGDEGRKSWAESLIPLRLTKSSDVSRTAVREGTIDVDGAPHGCWIIERTGSVSLPGPGLARRAEIQETIWIDKTLWIDWQVISIVRPERGNPSQSTARKTHLKLNPDLPDSMFTFTPPPGTRQRFTGVH